MLPRAQLSALPPLGDRIKPGVRVLFVGINPGIRSAMTGHHFAGPSNRFWKLLHEARLVPEPIGFADDGRLPEWGYGITNIVARATAGVDGLRSGEFVEGRRRLLRKIRRHRPAIVALVGITVFRACFPAHAGRVPIGASTERLAGCQVFVLPNPSGRNANYTYGTMLDSFRALREALRRLNSRCGGGRARTSCRRLPSRRSPRGTRRARGPQAPDRPGACRRPTPPSRGSPPSGRPPG